MDGIITLRSITANTLEYQWHSLDDSLSSVGSLTRISVNNTPSIILSVGTSGHFPGKSPMAGNGAAPLSVSVSQADPLQPVGKVKLTLLPDNIVLGETDVPGFPTFRIPISQPPKAEERIISIRADAPDGSSVTSTPFILYRSQLITQDTLQTLTPDEAREYNAEVLSQYAEFFLCEECPEYVEGLKAGSDLLHLLASTWKAIGSTPQAGDEIRSNGLFKYEAADVPTAYVGYWRVERKGTSLHEEMLWSENEDDIPRNIHLATMVFTLASPAALFVRDSQGRGAGYDSSTHQLHFGFPIAISHVGDEPYQLLVPASTPGQYILQVVGTGSGQYTLTAHSLDATGTATPIQQLQHETVLNQVDTFFISDPHAGSLQLHPARFVFLPHISR